MGYYTEKPAWYKLDEPKPKRMRDGSVAFEIKRHLIARRAAPVLDLRHIRWFPCARRIGNSTAPFQVSAIGALSKDRKKERKFNCTLQSIRDWGTPVNPIFTRFFSPNPEENPNFTSPSIQNGPYLSRQSRQSDAFRSERAGAPVARYKSFVTKRHVEPRLKEIGCKSAWTVQISPIFWAIEWL